MTPNELHLSAAAVASLVQRLGARPGEVTAVAAAWARLPGRREPVAALALVGAGLARVPLRGGRDQGEGDPRRATPSEDGLLSRTAGALGPDAFVRLQGLRLAVVGCGRLGSLAAEALATVG